MAKAIAVTPAKTPSPIGSTAIERPGSAWAFVVDWSEAALAACAPADDEAASVEDGVAFDASDFVGLEVELAESVVELAELEDGLDDPYDESETAAAVTEELVCAAEFELGIEEVFNSGASVLFDAFDAEDVWLLRCDPRVDVVEL